MKFEGDYKKHIQQRDAGFKAFQEENRPFEPSQKDVDNQARANEYYSQLKQTNQKLRQASIRAKQAHDEQQRMIQEECERQQRMNEEYAKEQERINQEFNEEQARLEQERINQEYYNQQQSQNDQNT